MIALVGFTGTGKSTIGRLLALSHGFLCFDVDALIEQHAGKTIREIFSQDGEPGFRKIESKLIYDIVTACVAKHAVLVTGAGAVLSEQTRELLRNRCFTVHVDTPLDLVIARLTGDSQRPLLQGSDRVKMIQALYETRKDLYTFSHVRVSQPEAGLAVAAILAKHMEWRDRL